MPWNIDSDYSISERRTIINDCVQDIFDQYQNDWLQSINNVNAARGAGGNKLRTYKLFKTTYETEPYVSTNIIQRKYRSAFAKFRCGVAPLKKKIGRYQGLLPHERYCFNCLNLIEDEFHVLMVCYLYDSVRQDLFSNIQSVIPDFSSYNDHDKFCHIMSNKDIVKYSAKACHDILAIRTNTLYK